MKNLKLHLKNVSCRHFVDKNLIRYSILIMCGAHESVYGNVKKKRVCPQAIDDW